MALPLDTFLCLRLSKYENQKFSHNVCNFYNVRGLVNAPYRMNDVSMLFTGYHVACKTLHM